MAYFWYTMPSPFFSGSVTDEPKATTYNDEISRSETCPRGDCGVGGVERNIKIQKPSPSQNGHLNWPSVGPLAKGCHPQFSTRRGEDLIRKLRMAVFMDLNSCSFENNSPCPLQWA